MIIYIEGMLQIHSLNIRSEKELNDLVLKITKSVQDLFPDRNFDNDIEFDVTMHAGNFEE